MKTNNKYLLLIALFVAIVYDFSYGQAYQGPAAGSISSGVLVNTNSFLTMPSAPIPLEPKQRNIVKYEEPAMYIPLTGNEVSGKDIYTEDRTVSGITADSVVSLGLASFNGLSQTNSIPPDPHIAVGPMHIVATVNTDFGIYDKKGNLLKRISADTWYGSTVTNPGAFDPKVIYDFYAKRWVMVWLSTGTAPSNYGYHLISVSKDSSAIGQWYNFALPSDRNGNTVVSNWTDYQGVGFDSVAVYVTGNQFGFNPQSFQYGKIRIINKASLYAHTGGAVSWNDLWDIKYPASVGSSQAVFHIRPCIPYSSTANGYYLLNLPSSGGNFAALYKIVNPVTTPVLTGVAISVFNYQNPPNATQPEGLMQISTNGAQLQNEPVFRDGSLYAVHTVTNPTTSLFSALHYLKIDVVHNTIVEQNVLGATGLSYYFPAITADKDANVAVVFSRSGTNEYAGAYYSPKLSTEAGLTRSNLLKAGVAGYVKLYGGTRNRWGDYLGISLDPTDQASIYTLGEYVISTNNWATWVDGFRMASFAGAYAKTSRDTINFGNVEKSKNSDTLTIALTSFGNQTLTINSLAIANSQFKLLGTNTFPIQLASHTSMNLKFQFTPTDTGLVRDSLIITSNAGNLTSLPIKGFAYVINPALASTMYSSSGSGNAGNISTINKTTGVATNLGYSNFIDLKTIAIHPKTGVIYGIRNSTPAELVRVNGKKGDSYKVANVNIPSIEASSFDTSGTFYFATREGKIYTLDIITGVETLKSTTAIKLSAIAFHPRTNELWGAAYVALGSGKDRIMKINVNTGDTATVGLTGFSVITNDLEFDYFGKLFGVKGATATANDFFQIDTLTGSGTMVGSTNVNHLLSIAFNNSSGTDIKEDKSNSLIPKDFSVSQNYPNPFNPSTVFEFSLPVAAETKITIYNILGETVNVLFSGFKESGNYKVEWLGDDIAGKKLASGVYFYEVRANGVNRKEYKSINKMIMLK